MLQDSLYDLVLLDLMLPDMSGFDVLRKIKARENSPSVIILSAMGSVDNRVQGLDLGADDYMTKSAHLLCRALRPHRSGHTPQSPVAPHPRPRPRRPPARSTMTAPCGRSARAPPPRRSRRKRGCSWVFPPEPLASRPQAADLRARLELRRRPAGQCGGRPGLPAAGQAARDLRPRRDPDRAGPGLHALRG